jgi:alkyl hydroperoxide reductase subunit F
MIDASMQDALRVHFEKLQAPIELTAMLDHSGASGEMRMLLDELARLSSKITIRFREGADVQRAPRVPSFTVGRVNEPPRVTFAGVPMGHEFTSLVLAMLQVSGYAPKIDGPVVDAVRALASDLLFETYVSLSCQNCPDVVQSLNAMAAINPRIRHTMIDGALFPSEVEAKHIMAVPAVFLNGQPFAQGRMGVEEIVAKLDAGAASRAVEALAHKAPYDVLVVGGGPAGAAAAIYAARKGIRTGLVTERFGGQMLDTVGIENFISVPHTEGPMLVAQLEAHVQQYDVDTMKMQRAVSLVAAPTTGGLHEIRLESGAKLRARTLVLSPGARWRHMGVPGEAEYRNKGVTFCPHCDGPLFRGKRVAVIGGGNSGVEAAIDLAGLVSHVTVLEFDDALRADAVLQRKLESLGNVSVVLGTQTTEVLGDGAKVTGLRYRDRAAGQLHDLALDGVFVQIGLLPNTEWLRDSVALSARGEIEVDARGQTSVPGVFAAGDATTTPYKQIVIAMGEGAKASLSAFDFLIRTPLSASAASAANQRAA